ncbi:hypothetical protein K2173_014753 [Erythroxylum novogranatense]|uniref:Protein kinase domain-containing protein n=1 Tax=Erythroxylum novogranatense TaxID=1862640 RepID=A0AAV8TGU5_9ROSI|nr:hypothetical protein K2173_014753 [Erythroxylum novogranatense]
MEKLNFCSMFYSFCLLHFFPLLLLSSASSPANKYFINCGSDSSFNLDGRNFVGDLNSGGGFSVGGSSQAIGNKNQSTGTALPLYQTARIFRSQAPYEFGISTNGSYLVRLHFFAFSSGGTNLSYALFNVSTSNSSLLSNFSVRNSSGLPVIKDFCLSSGVGTLRIYFTPVDKSSFAFINAIELFLMEGFPWYLTYTKPSISATGWQSNALRTLYRVNVGGPKISDGFWRNWVADDGYLILRGSAENYSDDNFKFEGVHGLQDSDYYEAVAPDLVYKTCKEVNRGTNKSHSSNTTWRFSTRKSARHLFRLQVCNIIAQSPPEVNTSLYIGTKFKTSISIHDFGVKLFYDYVVDSDDSGYTDISISPDGDSEIAFLNGLEIMEFVMNIRVIEPTHEHHSRRLFLIIGLAIGGLALISFLVLLLVLRRKRGKKPTKPLFGYEDLPYLRGKSRSWITEKTKNVPLVANLNLKLRMSFADILAATHNFDVKLLIGEGGFGKVYQGILASGMKVAVKRSDSSHGQGLPEFQTEVMVLSKIRHRHLVSLIGYCDEGSEMILVYEFMEKGTLRDHLYNWKENSDSSRQSKLNWKSRLDICIGATKGLHYLHTGSDGGIIHRDVKSTNILLDEHYVAKVADFGLSQSGPPDPDHFSTDLKGSFGYLDPEYFRTFQLTNKSDGYAFGVVLCEVLCARAPIISSNRREEINLGQLEQIIDPFLIGQINPNSLRKFGETAEKCLNPEGDRRPTMLDVCWDLEYALQLQQTKITREPFDDSTTLVSSDFTMSQVQHLNSYSFTAEDSSSIVRNVDDSDAMTGAVSMLLPTRSF